MLSSINKEIYTKQSSSSCWEYFGKNDTERVIRVSMLVGAIAFAAFGLTILLYGHHILPQIFKTSTDQLQMGGAYFGLATVATIGALAGPKIHSRIQEAKLESYIRKNYCLVGTNIEGKNLSKILRTAQAFLFTEIHESEKRIEKNKKVIEELFDDQSIFLSELQVIASGKNVGAYYRLNADRVHCLACWDKKFKESQEFLQKRISLLFIAKKILEWRDLSKNLKDLIPEIEAEEKFYPEIAALKEVLKGDILNEDDAYIALLKAWQHLRKELMRDNESKDVNSMRQQSLIDHVIEFVKKGKKIFLVAGMNHLTSLAKGKWQPNREVTRGLTEAHIPYVILHPRRKENRGSDAIFWQTRTKKISDSETSPQALENIPHMEEAIGISPKKELPIKEMREKIKAFEKKQALNSSEVRRFFVAAMFVMFFETNAIQDKKRFLK